MAYNWMTNTYSEDNPVVPTTSAYDALTKQILGQGTTSKWSGEGFGSAEANAADMAKILSGIGITDINQFGQVPELQKLEIGGYTYNGKPAQKNWDGQMTITSDKPSGYDENGDVYYPRIYLTPDQAAQVKPIYGTYSTEYQYVNDESSNPVTTFTPADQSKVVMNNGVPSIPSGKLTYGNKVTGQTVPNTYSERQTGNAWGGTFAGSGNTGYRVQFDAQGNPYFYTTGASSNDLANLLGDSPILNFAANVGAAAFGGPLGTAALQLAQGKDLEDAAKAAAISYVGGQGASGVNSAISEAIGGGTTGNIAANAITSGTLAELQGGNFLQGALKGAVSSGINESQMANAADADIAGGMIPEYGSNAAYDSVVSNTALPTYTPEIPPLFTELQGQMETQQSQINTLASQYQELGLTQQQAFEQAARDTQQTVQGVSSDFSNQLNNQATQYQTLLDQYQQVGLTQQEATSQALADMGQSLQGLETNLGAQINTQGEQFQTLLDQYPQVGLFGDGGVSAVADADIVGGTVPEYGTNAAYDSVVIPTPDKSMLEALYPELAKVTPYATEGLLSSSDIPQSYIPQTPAYTPDTYFNPDYSLFSDNVSTPVIEEMGAQGLQVPENTSVADNVGYSPIDYSLTPSVPFEGLQMPTNPNLDSMGGGQGLTYQTPEGVFSQEGLTPTGTAPALGDPSSFINSPAVIDQAIASSGSTEIPKALQDAILKYLPGLFAGGLAANAANQNTQSYTPKPAYKPQDSMPTYSPDYFNQVQNYYTGYMPNMPRDVSTPLQDWYNTGYTGEDSVTKKLFGV